MKLYELSEAYRIIEPLIDEGQDYGKALDTITEEFDKKVENIGKLIREAEADNKAYQDEAKRFVDKAQSADNRAKRLKEYLKANMIIAKRDKVTGELLSISLQKSPASVEVLDQTVIPKEYFRIIPETREVDRKAILEAWKVDGSVPNGVIIHDDQKHIRIR